MGMESFYIKVKELNNNNIESEKIENLFNIINVKKIENSFIVNDEIIIEKVEKNEKVSEIILIGCFSNFFENINTMFSIIESMNTIFKIKVFHELGVEKQILNKKDFIQVVRNIYDEKYKSFLENFGEINFKSLPDNYFYKNLKKYRRKQLFKKIFRIKNR